MIVAAVAFILAAGAVGITWLITHRPAPSPPPVPTTPSPKALLDGLTRDKVVVTLKSGATFSGALYAVDATVLVLRNTQALGAGPRGETSPVDGELLVFLRDVDYLQRP